MPLLVRPKPEKGESFIGYLVRLTELNGYDTPSWILSLSGIDYMELQWTFAFIFSKSKGLEKLAHLTNNALSDLNPLLYFPGDSSQGYTSEHECDFYGAFLNRSIIRPHLSQSLPEVFDGIRLLSASLGLLFGDGMSNSRMHAYR
ncbi:MAG: hypothetical protein ACXWID_00130 [Pyrinomonadaceae bacterium]